MSRRRALRLVALAAVALVALAGVGLLALPRIARRVVVWRLAAATGRAVTLARVDVGLRDGRVALHELRVLDRDRRPLATLARLELRLSLRDLLGGHLRVTDATLQAPTLRIVRTGPSAFNVSDLLARESGGGTGPALTLERVALAGGTVEIEDRTLAPPRTWRVEALALEARDVSTRAAAPPGIVTVRAVVAGSPVSLWVTDVRLRPLSFRATAIARQVAASLLGLYLPPASPLSPARGEIDASGTIERDVAGGTRVALDASLAGVELTRPGQDGAYLSAPSVRVQVDDLRVRPGGVALGRLAVDAGSVVLQDARLGPVRRWRADGVALEARGVSSAREDPAGVATARAVVAGSPVSVWVSDLRLAPLELQAMAVLRDVDVTLFRLSLPPDLPVRPERGVVNASVRVAHDARRGTRFALDAGLSGVELRRPAHVVTAPALRVTAEDIAFGGGAVSVGRAALSGDRLVIEDRTLTPARAWRVRALEVEARRLSSRREDVQGVATARATVEGATVSAWLARLRLDPLELHATAIVRGLDLALLRLYLPPAAPVVPERGTVNGSLQVAHTTADGTRLDADIALSGVEARGRGPAGPRLRAPAVRVTFADARRRGEALHLGRFELTGRGVLADPRAAIARFDFERLRLAGEGLAWPARGPARVEVSARLRDGGALSASGTVALTAPPPDLAWTTELALTFEAVRVGRLVAWVPAARGLRGRARGDVTASVAWAGALTARVRGEVGAAPLALRDDRTTLLSVRRVQLSGLDVQWPARVAVGQVRLEQPHALLERDRQGGFALAARLAPTRPVGSPPADSPPAPRAGPALAVGEVVVERGSLLLVDERAAEPARFEVPRVDATLRDVTWPARAPARLALDAALPAGGTLGAEGTVGGEPARVDLRIALTGADLALAQPYLGFAARVGGRVSATLAVAGPLAPAPRLTARGDAGLRNLTISDGRRDVLTVGRLDVTGIDAAWPERVAVDRVHVKGSWALVERDRDRRFNLRALFERAPAAPAPGAPAAPPAGASPGAAFELSVREGLFEEGAVSIVDGITTPAARFQVAGARLAVRDFAWPARSPVKLRLTSPTPEGGTLDVEGTLALEPLRLEARAVLEGVELGPAQPYLPIEGRVTGRASGELAVKVALEPLAVTLDGRARLQRFRLGDGDRPLVTVGRLDVGGIDVAWPGRVTLQSVRLRRPRLLIERDARGEFLLRRLVTPRWATPPAGAPPPAGAVGPAGAPTTVEVGALGLERASARFVDHTTTPAFVEELSAVDVAVTGLGTAPGRRARLKAAGLLPGGASFALGGELTAGERPHVELKVDVRDYLVPRANPYLERLTSWRASRGHLSIAASYTLDGTRLDARHDVLLRQLEVEQPEGDDEVERRLGLPLGFLVALMKDARGELRLSVPVSGDLATREFDFQETVWATVRNLAIRLLALPFAKVGSLFFSEDSKVEAVAIDPVRFEAGTARLGPGMAPHLDRVAAFLRGAPALRAALVPVLTQADVDALKHASPPAAAAPAATEALRELTARRLDVVRQALTGGGVDAARLAAPTRRLPLIEAAGSGRVELDLRP